MKADFSNWAHKPENPVILKAYAENAKPMTWVLLILVQSQKKILVLSQCLTKSNYSSK